MMLSKKNLEYEIADLRADLRDCTQTLKALITHLNLDIKWVERVPAHYIITEKE